MWSTRRVNWRRIKDNLLYQNEPPGSLRSPPYLAKEGSFCAADAVRDFQGVRLCQNM
jgi:hypothetical protein